MEEEGGQYRNVQEPPERYLPNSDLAPGSVMASRHEWTSLCGKLDVEALGKKV